MKGDFTRDTFDPTRHFLRVLSQQGRVTVDADPNEQTAILLHYLQTLARDLIGPYAVPVENAGFLLSLNADGELQIGAGRMYVDGILVENDDDCLYAEQPDYPLPDDDPVSRKESGQTQQIFWLYLDVWERHITYIEDDSIREKALGGPDTCTRSKIVWQVKPVVISVPASGQLPPEASRCDGPLGGLVGISDATMAARLDPGQQQSSPCILPPDSKYRGTENQLYRVEIHYGGSADGATFKWSRDNGSIVTAWLGSSGNALQVGNTRGFDPGVWVELSDDVLDLYGLPGKLVRLLKVDNGVLSVDPASVQNSTDTAWSDQFVNPKVRRWDQVQVGDIVLQNGAVPITEASSTDPAWIDLEDGIQVQFAAGGTYRTGDYWLIPARVATGSIEWPHVTASDGTVTWQALPPRGIEHHYAPLGFAGWDNKREHFAVRPCRCEFEPLSSCYQRGSIAVGGNLIKRINMPNADVLPSSAPMKAKSPRRRIRKSPQ